MDEITDMYGSLFLNEPIRSAGRATPQPVYGYVDLSNRARIVYTFSYETSGPKNSTMANENCTLLYENQQHRWWILAVAETLDKLPRCSGLQFGWC
ncbi:MAG: hypothetical protein ACSLE1_12535 [Sphingobium sp.]